MLHTYFISLDASVTITENKSAELITENKSVEAITENERAENCSLENMLADLKNQNINQSKSAKELFIPQEKVWERREKFFAFLI